MGMQAAAAVYTVYQGQKQGREQRKLREQQKADQEKTLKEKLQGEMNAKKGQYEQSRKISRKGAQRGRMSTILDKQDNLG